MTTITPRPGSAECVTHYLKIDMTPLVDLGSLLISFFVFTATVSQPRITKLVMPKAGGPTPVPQCKSITFLLDNKTAYVYEGRWEDAGHKLTATTYDLQTGLGHYIGGKQQKLLQKNDLVMLLKSLPAASYQNVLAALDEMQINDVKK
jgi:biopolymer transport protein ExbD